MNLTLYTDYSLRVLIYLASDAEKSATISEIAEDFSISRNHLVKVVHGLSKAGFIHTSRGKGGGLMLNMPASQISLGEVVQKTEPHFNMVECFDVQNNRCAISSVCSLKGVIDEARQAFMNVLNSYSLADFVCAPKELQQIFFHRFDGHGK